MADAADLSEPRREQIAAMRAEVLRLMPELVPVIRDLHEAGLIAGWRAVRRVGPLPARFVPHPPGAAGWRRITRWRDGGPPILPALMRKAAREHLFNRRAQPALRARTA